MVAASSLSVQMSDTHAWLRPVRAALVTGHEHPLLRRVMEGIGRSLVRLGHAVTDVPDAATDLVLTTYRYGQSLNWRKALMFTVRRRYKLEHSPTLFTLVHMTRAEFEGIMSSNCARGS